MTIATPAKLNEYNHAEEPARLLLERVRRRYVLQVRREEESGDC